METANFEKMLREAASEAGVVLKQVSVTQQNADHPILWTMEETFLFKILYFPNYLRVRFFLTLF